MIRMQFELPEEKVKELEEIMKDANIPTRRDLFNNALTLFEWALNERRLGRIIASLSEKEHKYKELVMPVLESVANQNKETKSGKEELNSVAAAW